LISKKFIMTYWILSFKTIMNFSKCLLLFLFTGIFVACIEPVCSVEPKAPDNSTLFVSKIKSLAELITGEHSSLQQALEILEGKSTESENNQYLKVTGPGYKAVVTIIKLEDKTLVSEVSIYPNSELSIQLKDIETAFGKWKKIHQSKTSSVRFKYTHSQTGKTASIYVELMFPPNDPASPVISIDIRGNGFQKQAE